MPRTLKLAAFALVTTAAVLAGAEVLLRVLVPVEQLLFTWEQPDGWMLYEETGNLVMRPDQDERHHDGPHEFRFLTNSEGLRETREIPREKATGETRLLALGDSWMFGLNATEGEGFADRLEELAPEALGAETVEVVNAGVAGGCAFDMLRMWRRFGTVLEPDGLVLGTPHNDGRQREVGQKRTAFYAQETNAPVSTLRLYLGLRRLLAPLQRPSYPRLGNVSAAVADLLVLVDEARTRDLPVWLVVWPIRWENQQEGASMDFGYWRETFEPYGVTVVGHPMTERSCWGYQDTSHASEAGYHAAAELLASVMGGATPPTGWTAQPLCDEVDANGPGKPGFPDPEDGTSLTGARAPASPGQKLHRTEGAP